MVATADPIATIDQISRPTAGTVSKLERLLGPFTSDPHLRLDIAVALQALYDRS